ncbi:MAG: FecR family protein, partial [Deltaproteobacteria bacterium]|nr:FecR family protein [Deltaproteobacteria bacterium]
VTSRSGQATIKFRDGSEIRVLPNTDFKVDLVQEKGKSARAFQYKLSMKLGSVWGNFIKQKHAASVTTTTATIGIKGTTLRVVERDGKARVALTEGEVEVKNTRHKATLTPGKRLSDFGPTDDLPKKVEDIPFKLDVKTDVKKLVWEDSRNAQAYVTLQLVDVKRAGNMARSGSVYLRSNYDKVVYPGQVNLNERGFARVQLEFPKPDGSDSQLAGNIYVWAVMAGEKDDDVGEGKVLFTYDPPPTTKKIQVRADTGETKQVK